MNHVKKKIGCMIGIAILCCMAVSCTSGGSATKNGKGGASVTGGQDEVVNEQPNPDSNAQVYRDSTLGASVVYANQMANTVQGYFADASRECYVLENSGVRLTHRLAGTGGKQVTSIKDAASGGTYLENSMDVYIKTADDAKFYASSSYTNGRMNTTRLGYYYYETHIRDLGFGGTAPTSSPYQYETDVGGFGTAKWESNCMSDPVFSDGVMTVQVTDLYDPYVFRKGLQVPKDQYNAVEVTLRTDGTSNSGEVFFFTDATGDFNSEQCVSFSIQNDGQYHTYLIDLSASRRVNGALLGIRFDIGTSEGETVQFQSVKAVKADFTSVPFKLDKTFHAYPDKMHEEYRIIATGAASGIAEYGLEVKFPENAVASFQMKTSAGGYIGRYLPHGASNIEYAAFDIKDVGIIGFIIPNDGLTENVSVAIEDGFIVFRQKAVLPSRISTGQEILFGNRIYTDTTHSFDGIETQAQIERKPLTGIRVTDTSDSNCTYIGYDMLRGAYRFTIDGSEFNKAYFEEPDRQYTADIQINGDSLDRNIYIWMNGKSGCLESAAVLDDKKMLVPVPVEVCKNFQGEMEEPFYDPYDPQYGDSFYPLKIEAHKTSKHTSIHLYQNWGKFPLKQLSSIQFHITYYHLSTGVTESNCIAPYFVFGKDEWTLPDFRGCSGIMWPSQPQFNAVGRLRFVSYLSGTGKVKAEYTGTKIRSAGPVYADLDYNYISDCGSYSYTLRHTEFPQNDENRTYYTLDLTFLKDLTIEDVRKNFTLFNMDGRAAAFSKLSYLNEAGNTAYKNLNLNRPFAETLVLGKENPFFSYYGLGSQGSEIMNFAYMVKNYDITIGGQKWDGNFVLRNTYDGNLNTAYISLDEGTVSFQKGDSIKINFILLPWGDHHDTEDENVHYVIEDSIKHPVQVTASKGTVVADDYIPMIRAESNSAEFTLTGGRNRNAVRIDGFTKFGTPVIYEIQEDGGRVKYDTTVHGYDGYGIFYNEDGTYGYSFIYEMGAPEEQRTFQIEIQ